MERCLDRTPILGSFIRLKYEKRYQEEFDDPNGDESKSTTFLQACCLLEDAIDFRSIFHKLNRDALIVYRLYYSKTIQYLLNFNIFVILMLAFFESPSSLSISSDISKPDSFQTRYEFRCRILETIDLFCLSLFILDAIVKSYLIGKKSLVKTPWLIAYYVVLIISITDCVVSMIMGCNELFRIRRYLRPFFLIQSSSLMKKTIKSLKKTFTKVISVFVLLIINVYFFAIIGMLLFPRYYIVENLENKDNATLYRNINKSNSSSSDTNIYEKNKTFATIKDSLLNLLILITTSNNPDVMIQVYSYNRFSALFFIIYILIGIYCIMSLVTAVIYDQFKGFFKDSLNSSAFRQSLAIRASFWILHEQFKNENLPGYLPKSAVSCVIKNLSVSNDRRKILLKCLDELSYCIQDTSNPLSHIELEQFEKLFQDNINTSIDEYNSSDYDILTPLNNHRHEERSLIRLVYKYRKVFKTIFESKFYGGFSCFLTIINIGCITAELDLVDQVDYPRFTVKILSFVIFGFSIYYFIENILKSWSFGWEKFLRSYTNVADGLISLTFLVLQIIQISLFGTPDLNPDLSASTSIWGISRGVNMLLIFRLIHLAPNLDGFNTMLSTSIDIIRSLKPLFGIMICIYYIYALLGMQLFSNKIKLNSFPNYNKSFPNKYCGSYKQLDYWPSNFNDFYSSLVVLWNTMVINNWQVLQDAFADVTNEWSRFYFIFWWIICTVITLNMCISLILDLYVLKWETHRKNKNQSKKILIKSIHRLFRDTIVKPEDDRLNEELNNHSYFDFKKIIVNFDNFDEL